MGLVLLSERHAKQILGVLSCYDRVIVQGTLPVFCYADGMTAYLTKRRIRIFDFTQFAKPLTDAIKANAEALAASNGLSIDYVRKKNFRKEDRVKQVLCERGDHPGLVWIFSALEPCTTYQPWHDKDRGRTYLRPDDGKCLHYYFYFHRRGIRAVLRPGADVVPVPLTVLLQRSQLAGASVAAETGCLHAAGQRVRRHWGLESGAANRG
jgi:hypothetical protein